MRSTQDISNELSGKTIKEIFRHAGEVALLHACLTSPRGDYFRFHLLQAMEVPVAEAGIEKIQLQSGTNEYHRHLLSLMRFGLVHEEETEGVKLFSRTDLGERAINAVRELERRITDESAQAIYLASLGPNSIRFFLRTYGNTAEASWNHLQIRYSPAEMGRLSLFLPRAIDGVSAIDSLNEADIVVYREDNYVYMHATKARSFYQYLRELYGILKCGWHRNTHPQSGWTSGRGDARR